MAMSSRFNNSSRERSPKLLSTDENRARRLWEMQRRLKSLQIKRFHLRHELEAVEKYASSLDNQIKDLESYHQLSFDR